jgi:hypothetical protein
MQLRCTLQPNRFIMAFVSFIVAPACVAGRAPDLDLSGEWSLQPIAESAWSNADPAGTPWYPAIIPANGWITSAADSFQSGAGVWLKRTFVLDTNQATGGAALVWEQIRWGFVAYFNGQPLPEIVGNAPGSLDIPQAALQVGDNTLLLKIRSFAGLPRGRGGEPLFPIGSARFAWGNRDSFIDGVIGLDLHRGVRIRAALIDGDPQRQSVRLELRGQFPAGTQARLRVFSESGELLGEGTGDASQPLAIATHGLPAWAFDSPKLCRAEIDLLDANGTELDRKTETFGARRLTWDARLKLDGVPHTLLGSNLVHEWLSLSSDDLRRLLIDEARAMNVGGFRTHTLPPPKSVADLCDREGMWLLAEMPATYNGIPIPQTPGEEAVWRENAKAMTLAWTEWLYNHPSIVAWVPVNEPPPEFPLDVIDWIHRDLFPAVAAASPGRPLISALGRTQDVDDLHVYQGFWSGHEGAFRSMAEVHAACRSPDSILGNTEYIENWNPERSFRWAGPAASDEEQDLRFAAIGANQTEDLRRLGYTLVLPYWFANWTGPRRDWNQGAPTRMFPALRSALAPVGVVLDLTDRNFIAGSTCSARVFVVNDTATPVTRELSLYLETVNPSWQASALRTSPLLSQIVVVPEFTRLEVPIELTLPTTEDTFTLVAQIDAVLSQRTVRTVAPPVGDGRSIVLLGAPQEVAEGLRRLGLRVTAEISPSHSEFEGDTIVVWESAQLSAASSFAATQIRHSVRLGRRILVLRQPAWSETSSWTALTFADQIGYLNWTSQSDHGSTLWLAQDHGLPIAWNKNWGDGWNGHEGMVTDLAIVAPWLPGNPPALQNRNGWIPAIEGSQVLPISALRHDWPTDHIDSRFHAEGKLRPFTHLRSSSPALLLTRRPAPDGGYRASLRFTSPAMAANLMVFEHGRAGSSPFRWRINHGPWREVSGEVRATGLQRVHAEVNVWFGWTPLGELDLEAGEHLLELAVDQPSRDGTTLLALDDFLLMPKLPVRVIAQSGSGRPAVIELPADKGTLVICQALFGRRLDPAAAEFDPAAARFFLSLLSPRR